MCSVTLPPIHQFCKVVKKGIKLVLFALNIGVLILENYP